MFSFPGPEDCNANGPSLPLGAGSFFCHGFGSQNAPLVSEGTEPGTLAIDLSSSLEARHQRMVAGAY